MDYARLRSSGRILAVLAISACLPRCAIAQSGADQVSASIFDPVNNAIRVEAFPGGSGTHTPSDADQVLTSIFDATNNAIHVDLTTNPPSNGNCLVWNGAAWEPGACGAPGSSMFQVNGANATVQTLINFQSSAVTNGLTFTFTNTSAGNIQLGLSGTLADAGLASAYSGVGTCPAGQYVSGLARNAAPACGTPAGAGGAGTVTSFSAGSLSPLFTAAVATRTTTPALSFTLSSVAANSWFGNATGSSGGPAFNTSALPVSLIPALNYQAPLSTFAAPAHDFLTGFTWPNTFTVAQPGFTDLSGTAADAQLANAYSGVGICSAGQFVSGLTRNTAPTCATPAGGSFTAGGDLSGIATVQNVIGLHFGATGLVLGAVPASGQCLEYNGTNITGASCGAMGFPSSWSGNDGVTNAIIAQPVSAQDATALNVRPSLATLGTENIFQVGAAGTAEATSCSTGVYFAVLWNGNLCFAANNLGLGYDGQPAASGASHLDLHGDVGNAAYVQYFSPALAAPGAPMVSDPADASSTIPASTYTFWFTYLDGPGNIHETTKSAQGAVVISTANANDIDVTPPVQIPGATGWHLYGIQSINGTELDLGVKTDFSTTVIFQSWTNSPPGGSGSPPTTNTTGGVYQTYLAAGNEEAGDACVSATVPALNCAPGTWIMTNPMTAPGDILYGGAVNADGFVPPTRLAIGSVGNCLGVATTTTLGWQACGGSSTAFQVNGTALTSSTTVNFQNSGPITFSNPGAGNITVACCSATTFSGAVTVNAALNENGNLILQGNIESPFQTSSITVQGGQDGGNSSSLGTLILRGGINAGTGAGGSVILEGGQSTSTGAQGNTVIRQPVKVGTVAHAGDLVAYSAADTVSDCALACANAIGIAEGASGTTYVDVAGVATTAFFDTATTAIGDVACSPASGGVAGELHDNGASACPIGTEKVGVVKTAATASVAQVLLFQ